MTICCSFYAVVYWKMMMVHPWICVICMCHSTRNLQCRITNPFFFLRSILFFLFFFIGRMSTIPNFVIYTCIYLIIIFSFFFHLYFQRNRKKNERNWDLLHLFAIGRTIEKRWKWEQQQRKKKTFICIQNWSNSVGCTWLTILSNKVFAFFVLRA